MEQVAALIGGAGPQLDSISSKDLQAGHAEP
jgi:hypothetical protein